VMGVVSPGHYHRGSYGAAAPAPPLQPIAEDEDSVDCICRQVDASQLSFNVRYVNRKVSPGRARAMTVKQTNSQHERHSTKPRGAYQPAMSSGARSLQSHSCIRLYPVWNDGIVRATLLIQGITPCHPHVHRSAVHGLF
jgi:hypothetical protein